MEIVTEMIMLFREEELLSDKNVNNCDCFYYL